MLDPAVLMRRAVRYCADQNRIGLDVLNQMPSDLRAKFQDLTIATRDDMEYNQLRYFRPFEHQRRFFRTGASDRRGILAANRIGKTVSTCYEPNWSLSRLVGWSKI